MRSASDVFLEASQEQGERGEAEANATQTAKEKRTKKGRRKEAKAHDGEAGLESVASPKSTAT